MKFKRSSGILMHITSLPSQYGIGDLGPAAYDFVDFLNVSGQKYWQILPLTPTRLETGNSPYSSPSAFAGNVLLISPELLVKEGYLEEKDLKNAPHFRKDKIDFPEVIAFRKIILNKAFQNFKTQQNKLQDFEKFCSSNHYWLNDFALYSALEELYNKAWSGWPAELRDRQPEALRKAEEEMADVILREKFLQYLFYEQWTRLVKYSLKKSIHFIGDIPFYISHQSADCWAHSAYFKLNEKKLPEMVSGVPPDMFSKTGQLWGSPVYDWEKLQEKGFEWWVERLRQNLELFDVVRIDHFRAFSAFWEVPADHETAVNGQWIKAPGDDFFKRMKKEFHQMPFIAEDLGEIDQPVYDLRDKFNLPGMNLLQYAFDEGGGEKQFLPHNYKRNSVVYTGTHDNNTTKGWYKCAGRAMRKQFENYAGRGITSYTAPAVLCRLALMSVSDLAVMPVQDVLGLGEEAVMNRPGTLKENWVWRLRSGKLTPHVAKRLREWNELYGR